MKLLNSANTKDWLEVTKNQPISIELLSNCYIAGQTTFTQAPFATTQTTAKGLEILVPTSEQFLGDLKEASRRRTK
jgi:hypothetical protein